MGGHCSRSSCSGGDRTPLRGAADLWINTINNSIAKIGCPADLAAKALPLFPPPAAAGYASRRPLTRDFL